MPPASADLDVGLLSNTARDCVAIFGVIGTLAGLVGLAVAITQLIKTRSAIVAAANAVKQTRDESVRLYRQHTIDNALRSIHELNTLINAKHWLLAEARASDLADFLIQLSHLDEYSNQVCVTKATSIRQWQLTFRRLSTGDSNWSNSTERKWHSDYLECLEITDNHRSPFARSGQQKGDNDAQVNE